MTQTIAGPCWPCLGKKQTIVENQLDLKYTEYLQRYSNEYTNNTKLVKITPTIYIYIQTYTKIHKNVQICKR